MKKPSAQDIIDLTGTSLDGGAVTAWIDDAALLAKDCLEPLDADVQEAALKYLVAHMITTGGDNAGLNYTAETLGDASWSYGKISGAIDSTSYGRMAFGLAPCLKGAMDPSSTYGTVRLIR